MKLRRVAGIGCVVYGILNLIFVGSPMMATMGPSAIVVGALFLAGGAFLLRPEGSARPRLSSLFPGMRKDLDRPAKPIDPLLPVRVLKLAEGRKGALSVSAVAMSLEVSLDDAQAALDELARKGTANVEVDLGTGIATYRFPEFSPPADEPGRGG